MHRVSTSPKRISPEEVSKDNSDIWRYSPDLYSALRKEKFSKANPEAYMDYMEAIGELGLVSPYDDLELQMDLEIFNLMLLGMKQREIKDIVGLCQATVSKRLRNLKAKFKEFYLDGE